MIATELVLGFDEIVADNTKFVARFKANVFTVDGKFAVISTRNNFAIIGGRVAIIAINVIFGASKFERLVGAGVNGKETAGKSLSHAGIIIIVIGDIETGERIENLSRDSFVAGIVVVASEDELIDENIGNKTKAN